MMSHPLSEHIQVSWPSEKIACVQFNRPAHHNALTLDMMACLEAQFRQWHAATAAQPAVVILRAAGDQAFSAGFDIKAIDTAGAVGDDGFFPLDRQLNQTFRAIEQAPFPVIAEIQGMCIGGALECALACDMRFASDQAWFQFPPARLGWAYAYKGYQRLQAAVGGANARYMSLTATRLSVEKAEKWGLVQEIYPADMLAEQCLAQATEIAKLAPLSLKAIKQGFDCLKWGDMSDQDWQDHKELRQQAINSDDFADARLAFQEKRRPHFQGK